jgi:parallel beta-helix repeat protein
LFFQELEGKGKMKNRMLASSLILTLLVSAIVLMAPLKNMSVLSEPDPETIIVPIDYPTIQEAINHAKEGDTIFVLNGTYHEHNLDITKGILLKGENKSETIIDGDLTGTVVKVNADQVTIANFTIKNSGTGSEDCGIRLYSDNSTMSNNIVTYCHYGMRLFNSHNNNLIGNAIMHNSYGIGLLDSFSNDIYHNCFIDNAKQVDSIDSDDFWDHGYPSGGNYWSNYTGVDLCYGPNQNLPGSDGIGDTPHNVTTNGAEKDGYPRLPTVHNVDTGPNVDTGLDYFRIQDAIDADETRNGHTIKVNASIYYEHVSVYKSLTLLPEDSQTKPMIDGNNTKDVLHITASNVNVSDFAIQYGEYGIHLDGCGNATLRNNYIRYNKYNFIVTGTKLQHFINDVDDSNLIGVKKIYYLINKQNIIVNSSTYPNLGYLALVNCKNITVKNLVLKENGQGLLLAFTNSSTIMNVDASSNLYGIYAHESFGNNITDNSITENGYGIYLFRSSGANVFGNNVIRKGSQGRSQGILLLYSNNTEFAGNIVTNNYCSINVTYCFGTNVSNNNLIDNAYGIDLRYSSDNSLIGNDIPSNLNKGIELYYSSHNNISDNKITKGQRGIYIENCDGNTLSGNSISTQSAAGNYFGNSHSSTVVNNSIGNSYIGIYLSKSPSNNFSHNNLSARYTYKPVFIPGGESNNWNQIYPLGGNYWGPNDERVRPLNDSYHGPDQNIPGGDGIGDTPYHIGTNNQDDYPLMKAYGGEHDIGNPSINFSRTPRPATYHIYYINGSVINYGSYDETEINLTVKVYNATYSTTLINTTFDLSLRNCYYFSSLWNTTGLAKGKYTIEVRLNYVSGETYFNDNIKPYPCVINLTGDINYDGKVDIKDLVLVINYFGKFVGHPDWNPNADVAPIAPEVQDGKVDIKDLVTVITHFGEHDP